MAKTFKNEAFTKKKKYIKITAWTVSKQDYKGNFTTKASLSTILRQKRPNGNPEGERGEEIYVVSCFVKKKCFVSCVVNSEAFHKTKLFFLCCPFVFTIILFQRKKTLKNDSFQQKIPSKEWTVYYLNKSSKSFANIYSFSVLYSQF